MAYVLIDDDQEFHLFWRIDDQNLEDGGKLRLDSGAVISANYRTGGKGGRVKITLFDWDRDGRNDLLLTTHSANSIPHPQYGIPHGAGAMVLLMLNTPQGGKIQFASPRPLQYKGRTLYLGEHACSGAPYPFGKDQFGMVVTAENGRFFLLRPEEISWGNPPQPSKVETNAAPTDSPQRKPTLANIAYGTHERQVLDFYCADSDKPTPLVYHIHGGGWVTGDKAKVGGLEKYLARRRTNEETISRWTPPRD